MNTPKDKDESQERLEAFRNAPMRTYSWEHFPQEYKVQLQTFLVIDMMKSGDNFDRESGIKDLSEFTENPGKRINIEQNSKGGLVIPIAGNLLYAFVHKNNEVRSLLDKMIQKYPRMNFRYLLGVKEGSVEGRKTMIPVLFLKWNYLKK